MCGDPLRKRGKKVVPTEPARSGWRCCRFLLNLLEIIVYRLSTRGAVEGACMGVGPIGTRVARRQRGI